MMGVDTVFVVWIVILIVLFAVAIRILKQVIDNYKENNGNHTPE